MDAERRITSRTCGKCKKAFPTGRGHDARTCEQQNSSPKKSFLPKNIKPQNVNKVAQRQGQLSGSVKHKNNLKLKKNPLPEHYFKQIRYKSDKGGSWHIVFTYDGEEYFFPEWLGKFNCFKYAGKTMWFNGKGLIHRLDGPAVEYENGNKEWWVNGKAHRLDGPAVECASGYKEWCVNGEKHRISGPAIEWPDGSRAWYVNGERHREDGPALEYANGYRVWYANGVKHRLDGPAVEYASGSKEWWVNGKLHRLDGPAVEKVDGSKEWWVNGVISSYPNLCKKAIRTDLTREEFYKLCIHEDYVVRNVVSHNPKCPVEYKIAHRLKF